MPISTANLPRVKEGDPISAGLWNQLVDFVMRNRITFGQACGLEVQETPRGTLVRASRKWEIGYVAKTTSTITARSGSTAGSGTVQLQDFDGTSYSDAAESPLTVYLFSATSISSGKYCWVAPDPGGWWHVVSVEC